MVFFLIPITKDRASQQIQKPAKISNRGDNKIFSWTPKLLNSSNSQGMVWTQLCGKMEKL